MWFTKKKKRVEELEKEINERIAFFRQRLSNASTSEDEKTRIRAKLSELQELVHHDAMECHSEKGK